MKISQIGYVPKFNRISLNAQKNALNTVNSNSVNELSNIYYSPINFTRKWNEHKSWGAQFDKDGNLSCKLLSFADNQDVTVEIIKKDGDKTYKFPMEHKGEGVWQSPLIESKYAKHGDSYRYIITKADGTVDIVKDPYSYRQKEFMGESVLYDHNKFEWENDKKWRKNPTRITRLNDNKANISDLKVYELNIPTFTQEGTFESTKEALKKVKNLGYNAIEIMPVEATYSFNWGYDGVDKFAPSEHLAGDSKKCAPDELKKLIDYAHGIGLNVIMDMVPNHCGPDGSSLARTGPYLASSNDFGDSFNYEGENSKYVRDFMVNAALNWLDNYHCDGLRLDMTKYMNSDNTMKQMAAEVHYHKPEAFLIAEDARDHVNVTKEGTFHATNQVIYDRRITNPLEQWEIGENDESHVFAINGIANNEGNLSRIGFDSEWDFKFQKQMNEALYKNLDIKKFIRTIQQSQNRVKYVSSHDDIGNLDGVRLIAKLMVPMLCLNDCIVLNENDMNRVGKLQEVKPSINAFETVKNQKAQLASEELVVKLMTGEFSKYFEALYNGADKNEVQEMFIKEVLEPLGISNASITPQSVTSMFLNSFAYYRMAHACLYSSIGPVMTFQGDEGLNLESFRFFREFESNPNDADQRFIEKGYRTDAEALNASKLGSIKYSDFALDKMKKCEKLILDLNKIKAQNPALTRGYYEKTAVVDDHYDSNLFAVLAKDPESDNEIYTIINASGDYYPREGVGDYFIRFPEGQWKEILNTDDVKYGGYGYINDDIIYGDGYSNSAIKVGKSSTMMFKRIA